MKQLVSENKIICCKQNGHFYLYGCHGADLFFRIITCNFGQKETSVYIALSVLSFIYRNVNYSKYTNEKELFLKSNHYKLKSTPIPVKHTLIFCVCFTCRGGLTFNTDLQSDFYLTFSDISASLSTLRTRHLVFKKHTDDCLGQMYNFHARS